MIENYRIKVHDQDADNYDRQCFEYEYYAHQAMFGMCYEFVKAGERLLDLGIGTGLGSVLFADIGLEIHGLDGSAEMLRVCRSKAFAKDLLQFDLKKLPLPYEDAQFNHLISSGVFHFFGDLQLLFREISRIIRDGGIFAFTAAYLSADDACPVGYREIDTEWGVPIVFHSCDYIKTLLNSNGLELLKRQRLIIKGGSGEDSDMVYAIYVAKKLD